MSTDDEHLEKLDVIPCISRRYQKRYLYLLEKGNPFSGLLDESSSTWGLQPSDEMAEENNTIYRRILIPVGGVGGFNWVCFELIQIQI
jgi:hypothetical protein